MASKHKRRREKRLADMQMKQQQEQLAAEQSNYGMEEEVEGKVEIDDEYSDEAILKRASENITNWYNYFSDNIERYHDDMAFALGDQWSSYEQAVMIPMQSTNLVFNKVYQYARRVIGYQRQNTAAPQVRPKNMRVNPEEVSLRSDLLRGIYQDSDGQSVEQNAFGTALMGGFGAARVITDYAHARTHNQVIKWEPFLDPTMTFFDMHAEHPTKRDGNFGGWYEVVNKKEFKKQYPDANANEVPFGYPSASFFDWGTDDVVTVCYYYEKKQIPTKLYQLEDGSEITEEEFDSNEMYNELGIVKVRDTILEEVWCYKLTAHEILERKKFPSQYLPLVFIDGDSKWMNGRQVTFSFIYHARDPQKFCNYVVSQIADDIKKGRKEQWLGVPQNVPDELKRFWTNPELRSGLLLAAYDENGNLPTKQAPDEVRESLFKVYGTADSDIQGSLGMFDASRGSESNAVSGVAYEKQAINGDATTAVYFDNLNKSIAQMGTITVDLMASVYNSERYVGVVNDKKEYDTKPINQMEPSFTQGEYEVVIEAGESIELQKEAALELLIKIVTLPPEVLAKFGDVLSANVALENTPQIMKRFQLLLDPAIKAAESGQPPPPPQPNPMEQMMQMEMQIKQTQQQIEMLKLQLKQQEMGQKEEQRDFDRETKLIDQQIQEQKIMSQLQKDNIQLQSAQISADAEIQKAIIDSQKQALSLMTALRKAGSEHEREMSSRRSTAA